MRPRNQNHRTIMERAKTLSPLSAEQERLMTRHSIDHIAKRYADGMTYCLDCGHAWKTDQAVKKMRCPHCGALLTLDTTKKRVFKTSAYSLKIERCQEYQVLRMYLVKAEYRQQMPADYWIKEAFQIWLNAKGMRAIVGRKRFFMCHYIDIWDFSSDMEIRSEHEAHFVQPNYILGRKSVIPELTRNGFDGKWHGISPRRLFEMLLSNPKAETLLKAGQFELLRHFAKSDYGIDKFWSSIKIAIRNHYYINDASLWIDLIDALEYNGKDCHNPKYICPENLNAAHDHWIKKREQKQRIERERKERERYFADIKQRELDERNYIESKSRFFDIDITDGIITIKVLDSVKAFFDEGAYLHHCVATNKYYNKKNSLILSAIVDGKPMETIELSLTSMEILQCRGVHNQCSDYHEQIMKLMTANIGEVRKRMSA